MNWKYLLAGFGSQERTRWAEGIVLTEDPNYKGEPLMVAIHSIGMLSDRPMFADCHARILAWLADRPFAVNPPEGLRQADVWVRADDFSREELREMLTAWLRDQGFQVTALQSARDVRENSVRNPDAGAPKPS